MFALHDNLSLIRFLKLELFFDKCFRSVYENGKTKEYFRSFFFNSTAKEKFIYKKYEI